MRPARRRLGPFAPLGPFAAFAPFAALAPFVPLAALAGLLILTGCESDPAGPRHQATSPEAGSLARSGPPAAASVLLFDSDECSARNLYVMAADGSWRTRLTDDQGLDVLGDISPDGRTIAFQSSRDGISRLYLMNADGSDVRPLTGGAAFEASPAWSPRGDRVAFDRSVAGGAQEVFVAAADGTGEVRLTDSPGFDGQPAWSPRGDRLAFATDRDGQREIYAMDADGTGLVRLTDDAGFDAAPAWSPDGRRIAFHSDRDGVLGIWVMAADGSGPRRLIESVESDASPAWSPDGRWIAFHRRVPGNTEVVVAPADGSGEAVRLTDRAGFDGFVDWTRQLEGWSRRGAPFVTPTLASIQPAAGYTGTFFAIRDPQGRIQPGDQVFFYQAGTDAEFGASPQSVAVSPDGTLLTGVVPAGLTPDHRHCVAVRPTRTWPSRFADQPFLATH